MLKAAPNPFPLFFPPGLPVSNSEMNKPTSFVLDSLRIIAAALVFIGHCSQYWGWDTRGFGHAAVVIFFVLSGYVITASTLSRREVGAKDFIAARLSRLYSVVLPALALTACAHVIGSTLRPTFYHQFGRPYEWLRYVITAFFCQNYWFFNASPSTNTPFWSLSYEFCYYVLFGLAIFVRSQRAVIIALTVVVTIAGPTIMLLLPCWLVGAALYLYPLPRRVKYGRIAFLVSALITLALILYLPELPSPVGHPPLFFSSAFLSDWILSLQLALTLWLFDSHFATWTVPSPVASAVRFCADHTFSLYLYHYPLVILAAALVRGRRLSLFESLLAAVVILCLVLALSIVTESKRKVWRRAFHLVLGRFWPRSNAGAANS